MSELKDQLSQEFWIHALCSSKALENLCFLTNRKISFTSHYTLLFLSNVNMYSTIVCLLFSIVQSWCAWFIVQLSFFPTCLQWVYNGWCLVDSVTKENVTKIQALLPYFLWIVPENFPEFKEAPKHSCCVVLPLPILASIFEYCDTKIFYSSFFWVLWLNKTLANILRKHS